MNPDFIVIIPARFGSTRLPGKALAAIQGKPMVMHVYDNAKKVFDQVFVATDHPTIVETVSGLGGQVILTADHHRSGTERCAEAIHKTGLALTDETVIINLQGDEPLLPPSALSDLSDCFSDEEVSIATLVHPFHSEKDRTNPNRVKAWIGSNGIAINFSRETIAVDPGISCLQHLGVYAFRHSILNQLVNLPPTKREELSSLEQLRWLDNGYAIHCITTDYQGFGIDTPEDYQRIKKLLEN